MDHITQAIKSCDGCKLRSGCTAPVPGKGPNDALIMFIGEAPGQNEDRKGEPFVGQAGQELENYLYQVGVDIHDAYRTNIQKCWPGKGNPTPTPAQAKYCSSIWLDAEIDEVSPRVIVALGGVAIRHFLGDDVTVEETHGIPRLVTLLDDRQVILLPAYHPAAGLHKTSIMSSLQSDFRVLKELLSGKPVSELCKVDEYPEPIYRALTATRDLPCTADLLGRVAVDTETNPDGSLWCVSFCFSPSQAYVVMAEDLPCVQYAIFGDPTIKLIFHNAPFDVEVLEQAGVTVKGQIEDTMAMAYLLQCESQGLKQLSRRWCGMEMQSYQDVVAPGQRDISVEYLLKVTEKEWPDPVPTQEVVWDSKKKTFRDKVRKPQSISKKVKRILADTMSKNASPWERWHHIEYPQREVVEKELGKMPFASLEGVDREKAIYYSARDADATLRVYRALLPEIIDQGMENLYREIEIPIMSIAAKMSRVGMPVSKDRLLALRKKFDTRLQEAQVDAWTEVDKMFNPLSSTQVANLLFVQLKLPTGKKTKGGAYSTDDEVLKQIQSRHPVVGRILECRRLDKMIGTYLEPLLRFSQGDGRVHCDIKTTRVVTGRFATADPNLLAMPVRYEEGREVRDCFVAEES